VVPKAIIIFFGEVTKGGNQEKGKNQEPRTRSQEKWKGKKMKSEK
jgi:hypothetical protein